MLCGGAGAARGLPWGGPRGSRGGAGAASAGQGRCAGETRRRGRPGSLLRREWRMPWSAVAARWSRSSISGRRRPARAFSERRVTEEPLRTPHKMAGALRAVALGRRCWWLLLLQRTRSPQTSASVAAASAGAASRRQMNSSSSRPVVCSGGRPLSLSPPKTSSLLGGTFRSPGRAEKRKVVPSLPLPFLPRAPLHPFHQADLRHLTRLHANPAVWRRLCWLALARLLASRFYCQAFSFFPYPSSFLSHFYFVTRMKQNQTKISAWISDLCFKRRRSWMCSGCGWVDLSSASGDAFARGEDVSLELHHQRRWFAFLFPLTSSVQERGVILVRLNKHSSVVLHWRCAEDSSYLVKVHCREDGSVPRSRASLWKRSASKCPGFRFFVSE